MDVKRINSRWKATGRHASHAFGSQLPTQDSPEPALLKHRTATVPLQFLTHKLNDVVFGHIKYWGAKVKIRRVAANISLVFCQTRLTCNNLKHFDMRRRPP